MSPRGCVKLQKIISKIRSIRNMGRVPKKVLRRRSGKTVGLPKELRWSLARSAKSYVPMKQLVTRPARTIGLPMTEKLKLRYVEIISIDPAGSGVVASYAFRANSIYDPNYTGSGHQPSGFDQVAPYYERCHVIGAKCKVEYTPTTTTASANPAYMVVTCDPNLRTSTTYTSTTDFLEKAPGRKIMCGTAYNQGAYGATNQPVKTSAYFKVSKLGPQTVKEYLADPDKACTYTSDIASETNMAYFNINVVDIDGSNPSAMTFTVTIDYICVFSGRLTVPQS